MKLLSELKNKMASVYRKATDSKSEEERSYWIGEYRRLCAQYNQQKAWIKTMSSVS